MYKGVANLFNNLDLATQIRAQMEAEFADEKYNISRETHAVQPHEKRKKHMSYTV
jgi:hypothetical protein